MALAAPRAHSAERTRAERPSFVSWILRLVPDLGAASVLGALTVLFYWRILVPNPINQGSFPRGDFVEQFYAFAYYRAKELMAGRLPLWNPYAFGGHPFIADIQSAVFYPPSWITTAIAGPIGYPFLALEIEAIVHIFLAGFFAYLLASRVAGRRVAGLIGGCVYAFGGYLSAYPSQQLAILEVHTWFPLVLLFVHLATGRGTLAGRAPIVFSLMAGLALGVGVLAGHPQASLYMVYGVTAYFVFRLLAVTGLRRWRAAVQRLYLPMVTIALGFGVAAVQLVPTFEFMGISSRSQIPYDMSAWAFPLRDILQLILPGSVSQYSPMYVGILPLALAIAAVVWRRSRETWFWVGLSVAAMLVIFGGNTIVHSVLYNLFPGAGVFRHQERGVVLFAVAMSVLAAIGARALFDADRARIRSMAWLYLRAFLAAVGVLIVFYTSAYGTDRPERPQQIAAFLVLLLAFGALLLAARTLGLPRHSFRGLAVALVAFDLISVNWTTNFERTPPTEHYRPTEIQKYLQRNDANGRTHNDWRYPLNYGDVLRVRDINGASPLVVERYRQLLNSEPRERVWQLLNVKYFLTWQGGFPGGEKISVERLRDRDEEVNLYALPDPLPRAYVAHNAIVIPDDARALRTLLAPTTDPGTTAILASAPSVAPSGQSRRSAATVMDLTPDRLRIETTITEPGILVLSEVYYPGWRATVNGQPADILRAHHTLRGVALPAGAHVVEMVFEPRSLAIGAALTGLSLLAATVSLATLALWRRQQT